jgi:hypothetical protein
MEKSPLAIPERVIPSIAMRFLILGIAMRIAATIKDNRKKNIFYNLYGLPCRPDA